MSTLPLGSIWSKRSAIAIPNASTVAAVSAEPPAKSTLPLAAGCAAKVDSGNAVSVVIATVPVLLGNVIVLSAVGSVTAKVVSKLSAVEPSKTILVKAGLAAKSTLILLFETVVVKLSPPSKFKVSVPTVTLSLDPLSALTVNTVDMAAVPIDVTSPFALAVITGICVVLPTADVSLFTVASVTAPLLATVKSPLNCPCAIKVPVALGNVIVLSAVGSVTVKVVSKLSAVLPSNTTVR